MRRIERSADAALAERHDPLSEVTDVDDLRRPVGGRGGEQLASPCDSMRPVREPPGRIVRADDEARTDVQRTLAEGVADSLFAQRLQGPVALVRHLVVGKLPELGHRALLVPRRAEVGVDRDARDEAVEAAAGECLRRRANVLREVAARVDDRVPLPAGERVEALLAVTRDAFDVGVEIGVGRPAVEERQLVHPRERRVDDGAAEEPRAAEQKEPHDRAASPASSRSTSSSVL